MTANDIQKSLDIKYSKSKYNIRNVYFFRGGYGECDYLSFLPSGYCEEIEIKLSIQDFRADFKKIVKHEMLSGKTISEDTPNRFYYACPEGLLTVEMIPEYAGLIYLDQWGFMRVIKTAPLRHKVKINHIERLCNKFYYGYLESLFYKEDDGITKLKKQLREKDKEIEQEKQNLREWKNAYFEVNSELRQLKKSINDEKSPNQ